MPAKAKLSEYFFYWKTVKGLLCSVGIWPFEEHGLFYQILPYLQIVFCAVTAFGTLGFIFQHITRVALVVKGMSIGTSYFTAISKIICLLTYRKRLIKLHKILDQYITEALNDEKSTSLALTGVATVQRLSCTVFVSIFFASGVYLVTPGLEVIKQKIHAIHPIKYLLIYPTIYPWDTSRFGATYVIQLSIEALALLCLFCTTTGVDSLFAFYVFQMTAQLRIMAHRLTNYNNKKQSLEAVLKESIHQYNILRVCRDSLEIIFGPIILWMMVTNAVIMCALIFQLFQMKHLTLFRAILITSYSVLKIAQTYLYTWSGTRLISESENYRDAIYETNWLGNKRVMSSIILMLNQNPLMLKPFGFTVISIDMFVAILNTTISYFFLLRTMEQKV